MTFIRQTILSLIAVAAAVFLWITYVPAAMPWLERVGLADLLGIEATAELQDGGQGGFRRGGATSVVVAEVTEGRIGDRIEAIGDGRAVRAVTLRSEVAGQVTEVIHSENGYVESGDTILRLDSAAERIALERAEILLEDAQDEADRLAQLGDTGAVTEVRLREAQLGLRTAELAVEQAQYDLGQREIASPIAGWLGVIDVAVGDRVSPQETIATITDRSEILIDFQVPERVVSMVTVGKPIEARPLGLSGLALEGEVAAVDNVVDRGSRTLRVQGRIPNDDDRLRAGMAFSVAMEFPGETLLAVDPLSVQWSSDGSYVWAVRDDKAVRVGVTIRQRNSESVVVESADLTLDDAVVIEGVQNLRPGADVSVSAGTRTDGAEAQMTNRARL
ncbi:efflux RND transporter periplasmic adaptor subunit [Palleronia pelagia]|uniref:RND family efflux transporter, MFP subunit n=1 Tax=Palleronia pelagia TaxID=387096 RepID=A0A1H8ALC8_9RHOB|nr:efflux RND transporter periplasmic adaptor subunit [Palleronia pelagia]SEM70569.1 RND family efflux transporter, MFP subunit [Palleronia pelagia]